MNLRNPVHPTTADGSDATSRNTIHVEFVEQRRRQSLAATSFTENNSLLVTGHDYPELNNV